MNNAEWVWNEISVNRIECVSVTRMPNGGIGILVKWHGPGIISARFTGSTLDECIGKLRQQPLPPMTWESLRERRLTRNPNVIKTGQEFENYLRNLRLKGT